MTTEIKKSGVDSSFDDFLREQGVYEEVTEDAIRRVLAFRFADCGKKRNIVPKEKTAKRLDAGRSKLNRLPGP